MIYSLKVKKADVVLMPFCMPSENAKVIFHPLDFVVLNGMKSDAGGKKLKSIVLLDEKKRQSAKNVLKSVGRAINQANYQWLKLRVEDNGMIVEM